MFKLKNRKNKTGRRATRSRAGDFFVVFFLGLLAIFMVMPMIYTINLAFKPLGELLRFPPTFFVQNPTLRNFADLSNAVASSVVPFSRYLFNSLFISILGTVGHVIFASLAAYPLAKHKFPGRNVMFTMIILALMFSPIILSVPRYLQIAGFGWLDSYKSILLPAMVTTLGLYLMKQFMEQISDSLLEAARIDGANEWKTWWYIVMPSVKPAYMTLTLFAFQAIWNDSNAVMLYITTESKKTLPLALNYVMQGGLPRLGATAVIGLLLMIPPIVIFIITQSNVIETMKSSGLKE
ncbi:MAG: carbohydrate ABC transporter permease [Lachnospiraceae bacterium]|jgi:ABC-type glycerol-3-phosphate transport system permease component|nr:carbohydrate ABC transporter permease [Lachnospiraceae bacterium]